MPIEIRYATAADAALITKIGRQTFFETFGHENTKENMNKHLAEYYAPEKMEAELKDPLSVFLLAYMDDELVGYAKLNEHPKEESKELEEPVELERIYSINRMIGMGIGKKLMEACLAIAREKNKKEIWLGVGEHNFRAQKFYTQWGFENYGEHIFVVGDDPQKDWLMKKAL
jgi:ribosomal protein S18 acetylase RimI-like enzyme